MLENSRIYILNESNNSEGGSMAECSGAEKSKEVLKVYNNRGFGVFYGVNQFSGRRIKQNLTKINAWYCEVDGDKQILRRKVASSPIHPSIINETRNGFHLLWLAKDATEEAYKRVEQGLVRFFDGDAKVLDTTRVLRLPGFYWNKDMNNRFLVKNLHNEETYHEEKDMIEAYPYVKSIKAIKIRTFSSALSSNDPIHRLKRYSVREGLRKLSGTPYVKGDTYDFHDNYDGTTQIVVNGSPSSSWIDREGKIGSWKRSGPNLLAWLRWYENSMEDIKRIASEVCGSD